MEINGIGSVAELSRLANIPATTLYNILENEATKPNTSTIEKLANFFNVKISDFLTKESGLYISKTEFKSISELLNHLMEDMHLSERELNRRTGVPQQTINRVVSGKTKNPSEETLKSLADFFCLTLDEIKLVKPLNKFREKGIFKDNPMILKNIPYLQWDQLFLLPDALTTPLNGQLLYSEEKNCFAVSGNDNDRNTYIVKQEPFNNHDLILCIEGKTIRMGNTLTIKKIIHLIPIGFKQKMVPLTKGQYKYIGRIVKTVKSCK